MSDTTTGVSFIVLLALIWLFSSARHPCQKHSVAILVLGDIGRSPRMMYHAESFSNNHFNTVLIGYGGSNELPSLRPLPHIYLSELPLTLLKLPFILLAPLKIMHQVTTVLLALLFRIPQPPEFILVQNPPSIPTLALVWMVGRIRGSKVIIDWHNLGYTILALKLGKKHLFVRLAKWFERAFGRSAYAHLFVTQAMHDHLVQEWHLQGHKAVLYDRPPHHFHKSSPPEIHELFLRLRHSLPPSLTTDFLPPSSPPYSTLLTRIATPHSTSPPTSPSRSHIPTPTLRPDRPALIVSSTSWTPDEDFGILIDALKEYERCAGEMGGRLPKMLVVLTGKGPLKEMYMREVGRLQDGEGSGAGWKWVRCISMWLEAEDYPVLLGILMEHTIRIRRLRLDMFGCGLPVCALDFACLGELVKDEQNGLIFKNAAQLADQLVMLLTYFPASTSLERLGSSLLSSTTPSKSTERQWNTWDENWDSVIKPLLEGHQVKVSGVHINLL